MAKKTSEVLLQEVVGQLRQLNRSSVRDQLSEAEATKRAESLMVHEEVQEEQQSSIIDGAADFQRRFLAGQAKTFTDRKTQAKEVSRLAPQIKTNERLASLLRHTFAMSSDIAKLASHGEKPGSLYVHDLSVEKGIGEVLKQDALTIKEFEKLGETVGDELSDAAHISRGAQGLISLPGKIDVDEDEYIKLANKAYAQWEKIRESDPTAWKEGWMWELLEEKAHLGNLEDMMQGSKVKLPKDLIVERSGGIDDQYPEGLHSASVVDPNSPRGRGYHGQDVAQRYRIPAGTEIFHPGGLADTNEVVLQGFDFSEVETKNGSLFAHDSILLDYLISRDNELDRQRNNDLRSQIENRREGGGGGMGMLGAGAAGGGGLGMEMLDAAEGGGFMGNMFKNLRKSPWLALAIASPLLLFGKVRGMFGRAGASLFAAFARFRGIFTNRRLLSNPMNWKKILVQGLILSALTAWSFAFDDETQGPHTDTFNNSDIDLDAAPSSNIKSFLSGAGEFALWTWTGWTATSFLLKKTVKKSLGQIIKAAFTGAAATGIRAAIWAALLRYGVVMLAGGTAVVATFTWPVWVTAIAAGIAIWQWERITSLLTGNDGADGIAQIADDMTLDSLASLDDSLFNRFGIKTTRAKLNDLHKTGDLSLLDGDGSKVFAPVDQRRINNSVNKVITQHFYANEIIPFGWTGKQGFAPL